LAEDAYWTSTEVNERNAWLLPVQNGNIGWYIKATTMLRVRPVSAFIK
jgi:hypothetical protein